MAGCAEKPVPIAIDLAAERCPALRPADSAPFSKAAVRPPGGDLTASKLKTWIDARELQLMQTQRAGKRIVSTYQACTMSRVTTDGAKS